jgi:membrane-bound ClpP family serine protease
MNDLKKYLGVILLLLGVLCLVIYKFALPTNGLLVAGIALEVIGILAYIFINKKGQ